MPRQFLAAGAAVAIGLKRRDSFDGESEIDREAFFFPVAIARGLLPLAASVDLGRKIERVSGLAARLGFLQGADRRWAQRLARRSAGNARGGRGGFTLRVCWDTLIV